MEILVELAFMLLQFLAELVLQIVVEGLGEIGVRSVVEVFRRPAPHPLLAAIGYALLGAAAGALSLLLFRTGFIEDPTLRVINLLATPIAAGAAMSLLGAWRRRREQPLVRLDRFSYGYLFAAVMALVRFIWAR